MVTKKWTWLLAGTVGIGLLWLVSRQLPLTDAAVWLVETTRDAGIWGLVAFSAVYAVATALLLPGSPLTLAAGAAWDVAPALAAVWVGAVVGATAAFLLGRSVLRERARAVIAGDARWRAVDQAVGRRGGGLVFLLRLSPVFPFNLLNLGLGATGIGVGPYVLATATGILPGTVLYVLAGHALGDLGAVAAGQTPERGPAGWAMLGLGLVATLAVTVWVGRLAGGAIEEALDEPGVVK